MVFSKAGLSHFFYVEANVRISYIGTFLEAMVLKLCTGYLVQITEFDENVVRFCPFGPKLWGQRGFFKSLNTNIDLVSEQEYRI